MEQIDREFSNLTTTTINNKIPHEDVNMNALESKVITLQKLLAEVIKNIEEAALVRLGQTQVPDDQEQVRKEPKSHQIGQRQVRALQGEPTVAGPQAHGDHHSSYQQSEDLDVADCPEMQLHEDCHGPHQQTSPGKPSFRLENLDTASLDIRPAPVPPEEHCNTANVEDKADSGEDRELQKTPRVQQCTRAPTEFTHDVAKVDNHPDPEEL